MLVLGIDTATAVTTVAVARGCVLAQAEHRDARRHAEVLPRLVRAVLAEADVEPRDLDLVAVGVGPGPFTGLRVGVMFARATAHALAIPVVGVMSLDVIARAHSGELTVATRSRRVEVAWATYDSGGRRTAGPLILSDAGYPRVGRVIGDVDGVDDVAYPSAAVLCDIVRDRLAAGERIPYDVAWPEDTARGTGAPAARILLERADEGSLLLPALPLYLRRPDAVPA